ncbi:unnamed protein product [Prorocentrum cordatum]|uniref:Glycerophosphocholine acyltransferase 1 n=1 Tax=Prorocentrum cordatum TaxID=2364126 RepID=A0ABN9W0V8_9DINO|nr:unnamed protein product [Polarella glacialis]
MPMYLFVLLQMLLAMLYTVPFTVLYLFEFFALLYQVATFLMMRAMWHAMLCPALFAVCRVVLYQFLLAPAPVGSRGVFFAGSSRRPLRVRTFGCGLLAEIRWLCSLEPGAALTLDRGIGGIGS